MTANSVSRLRYYPWHQSLLTTLSQRIAESKVPHVMLFRCRPFFADEYLAWYIGKALLCDGCSQGSFCQSCRLVEQQTHPNISCLVANAGKKGVKTGIDEVRALEQKMWQTPIFDKPKIAIIQSLDAFSMAAQNALLKTLEEPPKSTYFILSADDTTRVLPTILSRVYRLKHPAIDHRMLLDWLREQLLQARDSTAVTPERLQQAAELASFSPLYALELLTSDKAIDALLAEKQQFAAFVSGKCLAHVLVDSMQHDDLASQLRRYGAYVEQLIRALFQKKLIQADNQADNSLKYPRWQGVSIRQVFALRDVLMTLQRLQASNVNMTMQLVSMLTEWQNDREK